MLYPSLILDIPFATKAFQLACISAGNIKLCRKLRPVGLVCIQVGGEREMLESAGATLHQAL